MPIFYNTSEPTPGNKNTITDIATNFGIRDFLLNKKLQPRYPQIPTNVNGSPKIGEPVLDTVVGTNSNTTPDFSPIEEYSANNAQDSFGRNTFRPNQGDNIFDPYVNIDYIQDINKPEFGNAEWPHGTQQYPESATDEVSKYGIIGKTNNAGYREFNTAKNEYLDASEQTNAQIQTESQITKQINGYLNEYGVLNLGQAGGVQAANVIGSLLNGQGLGFSNEGLVTNFDLRSSLAGRALGLAGVLNDTELGIIGAQQLAIALGNNAAFNIQQEILGSLNAGENILNLIKEGTSPVFRPNYKITVPGNTLGRVADYTSRILGFTLPKSYLQDEGSIFQYENGNSENIKRANAMLNNTGKGQIKALITNVNGSLLGIYGTDNPSLATFRSGYAAGYQNDRNVKSNDSNIYCFYDYDGSLINPLSITDDIIPDLSYKKNISNYGFKTPDETFTRPANSKIGYNNRQVNDVKFFWNSGEENSLNKIKEFDEIPSNTDNKKSLLRKTQILFNSAGNRNIVSVKGDTQLRDSTQISTANGNATSKGSAVLSKSQFTGNVFNGNGKNADDIFCRSWVATNRYDNIDKLIRKSGLYGNMPYRTNQFKSDLSVLDDNGFVKIVPYTSVEGQISEGRYVKGNVKKYMFSIENLAWYDNYENLPVGEQGPGDTTTGRKGRVMWFAPYDINFTENVSVQWESTNFIGRGEPIYTYNNTERTGTLSFSIITDHPTYANTFRNNDGPDDNYVASFFAGCLDPDDDLTNKFLTLGERSQIINKASEKIDNVTEKEAKNENIPQTFSIYFPNDNGTPEGGLDPIFNGVIVNGVNAKYESGLDYSGNKIDYNINSNGFQLGIGQYNKDKQTSENSWNDNTNFGLNGWKNNLKLPSGKEYLSGITTPDFFDDLSVYLRDVCKSCKIQLQGYASEQGRLEKNIILATKRGNTIKNFLVSKGIDGDKITVLTGNPAPGLGCGGSDPATEACKKSRRVNVIFTKDPDTSAEEVTPQQTTTPVVQEPVNTQNFNVKNKYYTELNFFDKLRKGRTDPVTGEFIDGDPFIFDKFRERIRYFHPAFHSTTPEGLNSRLTFLHQCTRQGATLENQGATNLAFGRAPVCILRIGDFYYTKIVIDSLSIDYEPLVWDLNPEGIGVQPMIAKVTLGIKFIGGSSLNGPLNKLQNALSFNYYANTEVYDPRADYIEIKDNVGTIKDGEKIASGYSETLIGTETSASSNNNAGGNQNTTQEIQANNTSNGPTPSQTGTTTEPKITGIQEFKLDSENSGGNISQFKIKLNSENIFDNNGNYVNNMDFNKLGEKIGDIQIDFNYSYKTNNSDESYQAPGIMQSLKFETEENIKKLFNDGLIFNINLNPDNEYNKVFNIYINVKATNYKSSKNLEPRVDIKYGNDNSVKLLKSEKETGEGISTNVDIARSIAEVNAKNNLITRLGLTELKGSTTIKSQETYKLQNGEFKVVIEIEFTPSN